MNHSGPERPAGRDQMAELASALLHAMEKEPVPDHLLELAARLQAALDARAAEE